MDILTIVLLVLIIAFLVGNIILNNILKKHKKTLPFNSTDAKLQVLKSKVEVLHNRLSRVESRK